MKTSLVGLLVAFSLFPQFALAAETSETKGSLDLGFWYAQNNLSSAPGFLADDSYGESFVKKRYMLFNLGLRLDAENLFTNVHAHVKGRALLRPTNDTYALGMNDRLRSQVDEFALEAVGVGKQIDLWIGRQVLYEAGGASVDGLRMLYHLSDTSDIALYGGLSSDPKNLTGYIGPSYKRNLFSLNYQAAGLYYDLRGERFRADAALHGELFKGKLDRFSFFSQLSYQLNSVWSFSGHTNLGLAGDRGIKSLQALITSRPTSRVTNTFSFSRYSSLVYDKSNASAISVPTTLLSNTALTSVVGSDVSTASYNSFRDHIMVRILERNYLFGAIQFTRRMFDHVNQIKYTAGYRDPTLFGSAFDLKLQTDVIDNYQGFGTVFDALLGREFSEGRFRLEGGGSFYANERDTFLNNVNIASQGEVEKESAFRFNAYYFGKNKVNWALNYTLLQERDVANLNHTVRTHEIYLATNVRF